MTGASPLRRRPSSLMSPSSAKVTDGLPQLDLLDDCCLPGDSAIDCSIGDLNVAPRKAAPQKVLEGLDAWELRSEDVMITESLGFGATSKVFAGVMRRKRVAVKQLTDSLVQMSVKERESLCRELAILQSVDHEHVVRMYGVVPFNPIRIVMELCEGGSCFDLLHSRIDVDLVWSQKLKICTDVADAMRYLHAFDPPIIHRDLKSLNLLLATAVFDVDDVPDVRLSDFGLSRLKDVPQFAMMTALVGTTHWMAPEVLQGAPYDERVDVYSYGMILYEVAYRAIPFDNIRRRMDIAKQVMEGIRPALTGDVVIPREFRSLIQLCWHQDPSMRPDFDHVLKYLAMATDSQDTLDSPCAVAHSSSSSPSFA